MSKARRNKVLIFNQYWDYESLFHQFGWAITDSLEDSDLVQLTGGADIAPGLYKEATHPRSYPHSLRDVEEISIYHQAIKRGIPVAGICRGAQLINVLNGGKLWQDVDGHGINGTHDCTELSTGQTYQVNSVHHQMMRPGDSAVVLAGAYNQATFKEHMNGSEIVRVTREEDNFDPEAVYYPSTNTLCFQPHPEFSTGKLCREPYFRYIQQYLFKGK